MNAKNKKILGLLVIFAAVFIRLLLIKLRWINPDEGAHLLDARLFIEGLMPIADYGSRQPIYVFTISTILRFFGISYIVGRFVPVISTILTGLMLYVLGKRLYDEQVGFISAVTYYFLPLNLIWSANVKTEPMTILLCCISAYFLILTFGTKLKRSGWLILSGIFASVAFYVRQPSLYFPVSVILFLLLREQVKWKIKINQILLFILGYISVSASVNALFLSRLTWKELLFSQLNPLNLIWNRISHLFGILPKEYRIADANGFRILNQDIQYTITSWHDAILFTLFILVATVLVITYYRRKLRNLSIESEYLFFIIWFCVVFLFYVFQSLNRGFYTQYFTEAIPPLILLASIYIRRTFRRLNVPSLHFFIIAWGVYYFMFLLQRVMWQIYPGLFFYVVISILIAGFAILILYAKSNRERRIIVASTIIAFLIGLLGWLIQKVFHLDDLLVLLIVFISIFSVLDYIYKNNNTKHLSLKLSGSFIVLVGFLVSALYSGHLIGPQYEAVWSPTTVKQVVKTLKKEGSIPDTVLSGGMIWTFESGFVPFLGVSHPTEFEKKELDDFMYQFQDERPTFIILDGYTKRKFAHYWDFIENEIVLNYSKVEQVQGSSYPVIIYRLNEAPLKMKKLLATDQSSP